MNAIPYSGSAAFKLQDLVIHPATCRIVGPKSEVHLEPRVMSVLEALARKPGELVSRQDLLGAIWPGGEVYDEALTQSVYQLRQQLLAAGGSDDYRNLITTVPKRGYVLKAEVDPLAPKAEGIEPKSARGPLLIGALAVVLFAAAVWVIASRWGVDEVPSPRADSIAVLPFLPLDENDRDAALELGMADTLIMQLSGNRQLVVRPIGSVRRFGALERDSLQAGRELGVDAVVDGSLQRSEDTVRVTVRLLRVSDGAALWAETIHEPFDSIFAVQDQISTHIASALAVKLGRESQSVVASGGTSSTEAYEHYMQGSYHMAQLTPDGLLKSREHFRTAVELDPNYARAWLGLASVHFRLPLAGGVPPKEHYPLATQAARKALEINPRLAGGHAMLGSIAHFFDWDWAASEAHFRRAFELNPNDPESHLGYAHLLSTLGRYEEALAEMRRARELNPNNPMQAALEGWFLSQLGRNEEALRQMEESRAVGNGLWLFRITIADRYAAFGRNEEALEELARAVELSGRSTYALASQMELLMELDRRAEAEALLEEILQRASERYVPPYDLAIAYKSLGDAGTSLQWLENAYQARDPKMTFLPTDRWAVLWPLPEYQALVQAMNLQIQQQ